MTRLRSEATARRATTLKERIEVHQRLQSLGFSFEESRELRRISMTLQRWYELECGTENAAGSSISIERDEVTGKPFRRIAYVGFGGKWTENKFPVADLEKGALKRLAKLMSGKPELTYYVQTDPRGCALYVLKRSDVNGHQIEQIYTRGIAVY